MNSVRTCVGCRARSERSSLVRFVANEGLLVVDKKAVLAGRGAWLHPAIECLEKAISRRAFGRAVRVASALDTSVAAESLRREFTKEQAERHMDN